MNSAPTHSNTAVPSMLMFAPSGSTNEVTRFDTPLRGCIRHLVDGILRAVLFVLIGMEVIVIPFGIGLLPATIPVIAVTLLALSQPGGRPTAY